MNTREREVMDALATALRDARDSVAGELALERAAFKGYEGSSNIAQLEAELVAIDSALAAYDALLAAGMNTREREVMDAAAELCRQVIGMLDVPARHRDEANSLLERINALLAEGSAEKCFCDEKYPDSNRAATCGDCPRDYKGSASSDVAGAVDSAFNRPMFGRMIEADFEQSTATFEMEPGYYAAAGRFEIRRPQSAQREQFRMSQAAADAAHSIKVGEVLTQEQWDGVCAFVREQDGIIRAFHEQRITVADVARLIECKVADVLRAGRDKCSLMLTANQMVSVEDAVLLARWTLHEQRGMRAALESALPRGLREIVP